MSLELTAMVESSAKKDMKKSSMGSAILSINKMNNKGPKMLPCGTPVDTLRSLDKMVLPAILKTTDCVLSLK